MRNGYTEFLFSHLPKGQLKILSSVLLYALKRVAICKRCSIRYYVHIVAPNKKGMASILIIQSHMIGLGASLVLKRPELWSSNSAPVTDLCPD